MAEKSWGWNWGRPPVKAETAIPKGEMRSGEEKGKTCPTCGQSVFAPTVVNKGPQINRNESDLMPEVEGMKK
jgi:hypothetical protein